MNVSKPKSKAMPILIALGVVLYVLFNGVWFWYESLGLKAFTIPSGGMLPTLLRGDRLFANQSAYPKGTLPARGDVVIYKLEGNYMAQRVVGLPGDSIEITPEHHLKVNGQVMDGKPTTAE